jgi:hypothetical protein
MQSVLLCDPLMTFETITKSLWNSVGTSCHLRWSWRHNFWSRSFNHSKMSDVPTSEVDAKFEPLNVVPWNFCRLIDPQKMNNFYWDHFCEVSRIQNWRAAGYQNSYSVSWIQLISQCGPTFCESRDNLYNAANMTGRKKNTKILAMVKIKKQQF